MLKIREYARPQTLDEAYRLCTGKKNAVLGGMLWLKMQDKAVNTAIDLQDLGLDKIEKTESGWRIGAMVTLRDLELSAELDALTGGAVKESVRHIVGVQFRNLATFGGSLWGRYGFSDVLTLFMALDAKVELYSRGIVDIETFAEMPTSEKDLLLSVTIPYDCGSCAYLSQRNISTDFPVLTCALCKDPADGSLRCAVGARPGRAVLLRGLPADADEAAGYAAEKISFGSNIRGSEEYRRQICRVLVRRAIRQLEEVQPCR